MENAQQKIRLDKLFFQTFYLLNVKIEGNVFNLNVSGSTRNVYDIIVDKVEKTINCNCPDHKVRARQDNCVCKHCCFVIFKVCRGIVEETSDFFTNLKFNDAEFELINQRLMEKYLIFNQHQFMSNTDECINAELIEKFHTLQIIQDGGNAFETKKNKIQIEDPCTICYETIQDEPDNVECPDCKKVFHKACQEQWISTGNTSCVYCRSDSWINYKSNVPQDGEYLHLGY